MTSFLLAHLTTLSLAALAAWVLVRLAPDERC